MKRVDLSVTLLLPDKYPVASKSTHPEDLAMEEHGMADGLLRVAEFVERNGSALAELLWTYPDEEAKAKLEALREQFWTEPSVTPFVWPKESK